jgi:RHS repeat-associated protein
LVDASDGSIAARYEYDPYGNLTDLGGAYVDANAYRFSTKYFDSETSLYYYGYRYYSPEIGRWINRDPIGERGGLNQYGFISNNPLSNNDSLGLESYEPYDLMDAHRAMYREMYDEKTNRDYHSGKMCCYTGDNEVFEEKQTKPYTDDIISFVFDKNSTRLNYKHLECRCLTECYNSDKKGYKAFGELILNYSYEDYITERRVTANTIGGIVYSEIAHQINKTPINIPRSSAFDGVNDWVGGKIGEQILLELGKEHGLISAEDVFKAHNRVKEKNFREKCKKTCRAKVGKRN